MAAGGQRWLPAAVLLLSTYACLLFHQEDAPPFQGHYPPDFLWPTERGRRADVLDEGLPFKRTGHYCTVPGSQVSY